MFFSDQSSVSPPGFLSIRPSVSSFYVPSSSYLSGFLSFHPPFGFPAYVSVLDMNVVRWFGHLERMDNERLLKKVMNAKVDGRSARGRPRFGWMDGVKRALSDRRMDIREASERARNRNKWRMIVTQF